MATKSPINSSLNNAFNHPALWQASQCRQKRAAVSTGFAALDRIIDDGGWPQGALTELLLPETGMGELKLLTPLLSELSKRSGYQVLVAPPHLPYAPYFNQHNVQLKKLLIIQAHSAIDRIWASQQALASRSCSVVVCWLPNAHSYKSELRKLSLAARQGQSWAFVIRPITAATHPSPAALRIQINIKKALQNTAPQTVQPSLCELDILKQIGSWHGKKVRLNLIPEQVLWTAKCAKEWPIYETNTQRQQKSSHLSQLTAISNVSLGTSTAKGVSPTHHDDIDHQDHSVSISH